MITVGMIHAGDDRHGVRRYGRLLEQELRRQQDVLRLIDVDAGCPAGAGFAAAAAAAVAALKGVDIVHIQYNIHHRNSVWGDVETQRQILSQLLDTCRVPMMLTVHDVYLDDNPSANPVKRVARALKRAACRAGGQPSERGRARELALQVLRRSAAVVVHDATERMQLLNARYSRPPASMSFRILSSRGWAAKRGLAPGLR